MKKEKIFLQGYCYTGTTLAGDFLYEFKDINYLYRTEFDIPRSPGGIYEIGELINSSSIYVKDSLIRRTLKLFDYYCSDKKQCEFWGKDFVKICESFINKLVYFEAKSLKRYYGYTEQLKFPPIEYFNLYNNDIRQLNRDTNTYYLNSFTKDEYIKVAHEFLESLFNSLPYDKTVLHHTLSIVNDRVDYQLPYWSDYKVLIVDKDPRDIYCEMRKNSDQAYLKVFESPQRYVEQYKQMRQFEKHNLELLGKNGMKIYCEDFINNYDDMKKTLIEFFGLDENNHIKKFEYFNPEVSAKNVGIYKNYRNQEEISIIEEGLSEYMEGNV